MTAGLDVEEAGSEIDVPQLAAARRPDLILLDLQPHSRVLEVCSTLRSDPRTSGIPVIQIARAGQGLELDVPQRRGADVYLREPVDSNILLPLVRRFIRAGSIFRRVRRFSRTRKAATERAGGDVESAARQTRGAATDEWHEIGGAAAGVASAPEAASRDSAERAVASTAERLRITLEAAAIGTWTYSPDTGTFGADRQTTKLHGFDPSVRLNRDLVLAAIHPEDRGSIFSFLDSHRTEGADFFVELRCPQSGGKVRWNSYRGRYIADPVDGKQRWLGVVSDATGKKEAEKGLRESEQNLELKTFELQELNRRLAESNSDLQQFAGIIAHDLQSPLNAIMLTADELGRRIVDRESADSLKSMTKSVRRMHRLIRNVLDYSVAEWGGSRTFAAVDFKQVLSETLEVLTGEIRSSGSLVTADKLPTVNGDPEQLASLFQNLIGNAIKYRKPGTAAHVHVSAVERAGEWLFTVRDDGIGIASSDISRIFRIFERLGHKGDSEGAGIGLAICQRVVERHGGRIWVESEPGRGSNFHFTLPSVAKGSPD